MLSESVFPERFMLDHNLKMNFYILLLIEHLSFVYNKVAFFPDFRWASEDFAFQFSTLVLVLPTERVVSSVRMKVFWGGGLYCAAERAIEPLAAEEQKHKKSREFET